MVNIGTSVDILYLNKLSLMGFIRAHLTLMYIGMIHFSTIISLGTIELYVICARGKNSDQNFTIIEAPPMI